MYDSMKLGRLSQSCNWHFDVCVQVLNSIVWIHWHSTRSCQSPSYRDTCHCCWTIDVSSSVVQVELARRTWHEDLPST